MAVKSTMRKERRQLRKVTMVPMTPMLNDPSLNSYK
jgi:hypothetical protein